MIKIDNEGKISLNDYMDMKIQYEEILQKIDKIVNNKDITGIEAKLMIIDILNELKEGNE